MGPPPPLRPRNRFYVRQAFQQGGRQALTLIHELHFSWGVVVALDAVKKINQGEFGGWSLFSLVGAVIVFKKHEVVRLSEHMLLLFTACWRSSKLTPSPSPKQAAASTSGAATGGPGWGPTHLAQSKPQNLKGNCRLNCYG